MQIPLFRMDNMTLGFRFSISHGHAAVGNTCSHDDDDLGLPFAVAEVGFRRPCFDLPPSN